MKKLKKILAVVMTVVMAMGMLSLTASAEAIESGEIKTGSLTFGRTATYDFVSDEVGVLEISYSCN